MKKITRRELSAPFSAPLSVFYLGENVIEIWMSPLAVNEIFQRSTFADLPSLVHNYGGSKQQADVRFH